MSIKIIITPDLTTQFLIYLHTGLRIVSAKLISWSCSWLLLAITVYIRFDMSLVWAGFCWHFEKGNPCIGKSICGIIPSANVLRLSGLFQNVNEMKYDSIMYFSVKEPRNINSIIANEPSERRLSDGEAAAE